MKESNTVTALPEEFKKHSRVLFDNEEEYLRFIASLEHGDAVRSLRINPLKATAETEALILKLMELEPLSYGGGYIFKNDGIGSSPLHHSGGFYVQDPGAMCAAESVRHIVTPNFRILDMCAAPGGKSTQLAALLTDGGQGFLVSNEIDRARSVILRGNTERMGHRRTVVTNTSPDRIAEDFPSFFDLVLTDAPCSGEGMMRKYAQAVSEWSEENVKLCASRQQEILDAAQKCVCPGGYLMYSTCTFSLEENEMTVDAFLTGHPEFEIIAVPEKLKAITADGVSFDGCRHDMSECRRFYPHISRGEGQFFCLMRRSEDGVRGKFSEKRSTAIPLTKEEKKALDSFFDAVGLESAAAMTLRGSIMLSQNLPCPSYALCCGVCAGEVTKGRLVPHHHLFSAMGADFKNRLELSPDSREMQAYLRGETVDVPNEGNGWYAVMCGGCAVGGGKLVDGVLKNHYPKGLRNR